MDPTVVANILLFQADECLLLPTKIQWYYSALEFCRANQLHRREAVIHCRLFYLDHLGIHAENAICADPNYYEGYACRADFFLSIGTVSHDPRVATPLFARAITDFSSAYFHSGKTQHGCALQAISLAIERGMTSHLHLESILTGHECTSFIKFIVERDLPWECKHIHFLLVKSALPGSGMAAAFSCNLSTISWNYLLQRLDLNLETVQAIISLKGVINPQDVICHVKEVNICILRLALKNLVTNDTEKVRLCEKAIMLKKFAFAKELMRGSNKVVELALTLDSLEKLVSHGVSIDSTLILSKMRKSDLQSRTVLNSIIMSTPDGCVQLFRKAIKYFEFQVAEDCLKANGEVLKSKIDLSSLLKYHQENVKARQQHIQFIEKLLQSGFDPNGQIGSTCPLDAVLRLSKEYQHEKETLLMLLLQHGAAIERCTFKGTLIYEVTQSAIDSDDAMPLLEVVCEKFPYENYPDGKIQDSKGNNPYHLALERNYKKYPKTAKICEILSQYRINPNLPNNHGKRPGDGRSKDQQEKDGRYLIMQEVEKKFQFSKTKRKKKKSKVTPASASQCTGDISAVGVSKPEKKIHISSKQFYMEDTVNFDNATHDINSMIANLSRKPQKYFEPPPAYARQRSKPQDGTTVSLTQNAGSHESSLHRNAEPTNPILEEMSTEDLETPTDIGDIPNFEDSPWEVERTDRVKKFFANSKVPRNEKQKVVATLKKLADGIPLNNRKLCKEVRSGAKLFEAHYSKGSRIIFEIAIQFSPRLTSPCLAIKNHIYCEVIRVWDIVRDHDNLNRSINHVHECITKSQSRGKEAAFCVPLRVNDDQKLKQRLPGQEKLRWPQYYTHKDLEDTQSSNAPLVFTPAGSTKDDEYNVITFYSFDSSFVKSMLEGDNARRDFPFKEWPKEHDIINMPQGRVSILLLGRSGTGKTTCCLYRLWNQFQAYWARVALANGEPCFPQKPLAILQNEKKQNLNDSGSSECFDDEDADTASVNSEDDDTSTEGLPVPMQHFHQVFITKNYVLCAQMKKRFYDLAAGSEIAEQHMDYEESEIPTCLSDIEDHAYPLFLTARQFFVLLDNSLRDQMAFFRRDGEGKLTEKIISSDYDHEDPDTLLDLEESDSEDEVEEDSDFDDEVFKKQPATERKRLLQRREITASYFAEKVWPKISKNVALRDTKIDPLLVWMEIKSFIKGSMRAVEKEDGFLSQDEYESLGKKMAPNYVDKRSDIYKLFKLYQTYVKHLSEESIFDECDLNHSIYTRLNALKDLPFSIHNIYIDEVQDFTQAELSILTRICREPNDLFLTGDTAQSIMRGISFRFSDLKSIFYRASQQASKSKVSVKVPRVNELTINFRSHTGVLQLAASVIDLMKNFFPNSFDYLPGDEGMFPGPIPVVLDSCNVSDLALVLRTNKRESSTIEFGAHQVIIVQSEDAKKSIPDALKAGIVLTVFEAKGLEFDDVLLYNFFKDSKVDKDWRVVTSFLKDDSDQELTASHESASFKKPRSLEFDESQHKSLNAELKYLYTAITRAKCNLWIYDSDKERRLPMFHYWDKKELVKVIRIDDITEKDQTTLFSATSSAEEWKSQGDYFKKKRLWEPAMKCYQKANCFHLESEAKAYSLAQEAHMPGLKRNEINEIYLKAAHAFLKCDSAQHNYQYLENAAKCLKNAKRFSDSSRLYMLLGQNDKAFRGYRRAKDAEGLAKIKEKTGDYDGAIRLLLKHNRIADALKYASLYEARRNAKISECYHVHYMARKYAQRLSKPTLQNSQAELKLFESVMEYLQPPEKVPFYKAAGMHEVACDILKTEGRYNELFIIYRAQGWYDKGIQLAKNTKRHEDEATFIFFKATAELAAQSGRLQDSTIIAMLKKKLDSQSGIGAKANLIYGSAVQNNTMIKTARDFFTNRKCHNAFGRIEAFIAAIARVEYDPDSHTWKNILLNRNENLLSLMLSICKEIRHIIAALDPSKDPSSVQRQVCSQFESFYGLEKKKVDEEHCEVYSVPSSSYPWTNRLLKELKFDEGMTDTDGMLQLEIATVLAGISTHMESFIQTWMVDDRLHLIEHFNESLTRNPLHREIVAGGYLLHNQEVCSYFRWLCNAFEVAYYGSSKVGSKESLFKAVLSTISPQATCYFPVATVSLEIRSDSLKQMMDEQVLDILTTSDHAFNFNSWFEAWRMNCVSRKGSQKMKQILISRSQHYNNKKSSKNVDTEGFQSVVYHKQRSRDTPHDTTPPPVFVRDRNHQYQHMILLWLRSCESFRQKDMKGTLASCTIAVYNIVVPIASKRSIWKTVSVSSLLNVVTIHTIALLTMHAACSARFQQEGCIYFPYAYKNVVEVFHHMNRPADKDFFRSCILYIMNRSPSGLPEVPPKLQKMLSLLLKVMIGTHNKEFNPLRYALGNEKCLKNGEARHCLVFVLTLFCNMALINFNSPRVLQAYRIQIFESVKHCKEPLLMEVYQLFSSSRTLLGCCGTIRKLLEPSMDNILQANLTFNYKFNDIDIKFDPATLTTLKFQQELLQLPFQLMPQHSKPVTIRSSLNAEAEPFQLTEKGQVTSASPTVPTESYIVPELLTMDSTEAEEDDPETSEALAIEPEQDTVPQVEAEKNPTEDFSFCSICACPVVDSTQPEPTLPEIENLYYNHCRTETHITNGKIKDRFDSEERDYFNPRRDELLELLPKCESLCVFRRDEQLRQTVSTTESDIKEMDKFVTEIRNSAEWRRGVYKLENDFSGKLEYMRTTLTRLVEETEDIKRKIERDEKQQEKKDEEEVKEDEELEEDEDIEQAHADQGEKGKNKSRKRKRERRGRRSKK